MLGSHFDLDKEIAAIAAKRALANEAPTAAVAQNAYVDVDQKLAAFWRAITPETSSGAPALIDLKRRSCAE